MISAQFPRHQLPRRGLRSTCSAPRWELHRAPALRVPPSSSLSSDRYSWCCTGRFECRDYLRPALADSAYRAQKCYPGSCSTSPLRERWVREVENDRRGPPCAGMMYRREAVTTVTLSQSDTKICPATAPTTIVMSLHDQMRQLVYASSA
eukprot:scaffold870_cov268-Pinguiococcus_pyrenoidosus.AAC.89